MKQSNFHIISACVFLGIAPLLFAQDDYSEMDLAELVTLDFFAASVLSAHVHKKGEVMLGVDYMHMDLEGSRDGTTNLSNAAVLGNYGVTPLDMTMDMTRVSIMYALNDELTFMAMFNYIEKSMLHQARMGALFRARSSGVGDTRLSGNYSFHRQDTHYGSYELVASFGISLPTGSIDKKGFLPTVGSSQRLPYPMQLGSGTYDILGGFGYKGFSEHWYWGVHGLATLRTGQNDNDYTLGDQFEVKAWLNRALSDTNSVFVRLNSHWNDNIDGADPQLNPMMVPTADSNLRARKTLSLSVGGDIYAAKGAFKGNRLSIEFGKPIYQDLDGPQLKTEWTSSLRWQLVY